VTGQELAVRLSPDNAGWWTELAELYQAQGQTEKAAQARKRAEAIQSKTASNSKAPEPAEKK
jgi:Tfp pilus assembly protein PilF